MNIRTVPPRMNGILDTIGLTSLFNPRQGQTTVVPGTPLPLSMAVVGTLAAAVVLLVVLKKKKVL